MQGNFIGKSRTRNSVESRDIGLDILYLLKTQPKRRTGDRQTNKIMVKRSGKK